MIRAPIALFVYNRPRHTRATLQALRDNALASQSDLFVFWTRQETQAAAGVEEVRSASLDRRIQIRHGGRADLEHGIGRVHHRGVERALRRYGRAIVVEDDLATSPHFLDYMNAALERYEPEDRVMQISGYMFLATLHTSADAIFLPFITSWGWATWARAWRHYDPLARNHPRLPEDPALRRRFDLDGHYPYFKMLQAQQHGKIDSWAISCYLSVFFRNGLALYPKKSLVRNLGFDGSGVNCNVSDFAQGDLDPDFRVNAMPDTIETTAEIQTVYRSLPVPRLSWTSVLSRASRMLGLRAEGGIREDPVRGIRGDYLEPLRFL